MSKRIDPRSEGEDSPHFITEEQLFSFFKEAITNNPNLVGQDYFKHKDKS